MKDLAFPWHGGRPSLNFTATLAKRGGPAFDRLRTPADLARWFHEAGLADHSLQASGKDLTDARALREALYAALTTPTADLTLLNHWTTRPTPGSTLERTPDGLKLRRPHLDTEALLTVVAQDAADLLTGPLAHRIRECAHPGCWLLFVDESRANNRRWCSMETCGARTKMSRYRT
ncbi:ABATE domain-containing protein [Kribbella sp. NPDC005582]|uniref:CGNR zinc finger domain-containing protein n=1 Tax=Kribbella sp. NPDC005582 TaxID=3156893 RepID=UPI0033B7E088